MDKPLLVFPVMALNKLGFLHPSTVNLKNIILQVVFVFVFVSNAIVSIVNYFYIKGDIFQLIDNFEVIAVMLQAGSKLLFLVFFKDKILKLIEKTEKFWASGNCSESTKRQVVKISLVTPVFQKVYVGLSFCLVLLCQIPYSYMQNKLPLGTFDMSERRLFYNINWIWCSLAMMTAAIGIDSIDALLLGFLLTIILQFKILSDHLEGLDVELIDSKDQLIKYKKELKSCIEHQKYLLSFVKDLQDICSVIFTIQYLGTAPILCSEFYTVLESPNIWLAIQHFVTSLDLIVQLSFYCIPPDYLVKEMLKVGDAIYNSNWYGKHFMVLKKATQLIIQRAQLEIRFTGFGIVDMNSKTLITLVRISFSICTFLKNLKNIK